jgi:phosphate/phosphite/phosphonate ABC transporter binding protein
MFGIELRDNLEERNMKKIFFVIGILLLGSLILAACAQPTPEPTPVPEPTEPPEVEPEEPEGPALPDLGGRVITVAIENAYLPFNYILPETGEPGGWDYDFLAEACARLNCELDYLEFAWDPMIQAVADGQFDMAADGITIKPERAEVVDFSDPYVLLVQRLLKRIDDDRFNDEQEFKDQEDLIIGTQIGTTNYDAAVELVGEDRIITFDQFPLAVQALRAGDVDAVAIDDTAGLGYQGEYKEELTLVGRISAVEELGFIFPLGSDLVEPFNMVIQQMKDDGTLNAINTKWFGPSFTITYDDIGAGVYTPIQVLFVPSVDAEEIIAGGELLADFLGNTTGLSFEVVVPTSYAATLEEMCASPATTMGFIPGLGYVLANQLCGVDVGAKAVRFGYDWYAAQFVVQRDSAFETLEDLDGLTWAYPDAASTSGFMYPTYLMQEVGIMPGETVEAGSHDGAMRAVYNGEADFGTAFYSPPRVDGTAIEWLPGEPPDIPDELVDSCANTEDDGTILCGNWEPRDARRNLRREVPDVIQKLRILDTTSQIANDTVSFGPEFAPQLRELIMNALFTFAESDPEGFAEAMDAYSWTGVNPATDADYDDIRLSVQASGFSLEDLGE